MPSTLVATPPPAIFIGGRCVGVVAGSDNSTCCPGPRAACHATFQCAEGTLLPCILPRPPSAPSARTSRVAVCLTGHPRTFSRTHVHGSIRELLVNGLRRHSRTVDVFAVFGRGDAPLKSPRDPWRVSTVESDRDSINRALESIGTREVIWVNEPWLKPNRACRIVTAAARMLLERGIAQPAAWETCYGLIEKAEAADGVQYDFVVRARPDTWWYAPHPPPCHMRGARATQQPHGGTPVCPIQMHKHPCDRRNGYTDHYFAMPRAAAEAVMRGIARMYLECNSTLPYTRLEDWVGATMLKETQAHGLPAVQHPVLPFVLVRNDSTEPSARTLCRCTHPDLDLCLRGAYPDDFAAP